MSDLTTCNFCEYKEIKDKAQQERKSMEWKGPELWVDGKFVAWFMELPIECAC